MDGNDGLKKKIKKVIDLQSSASSTSQPQGSANASNPLAKAKEQLIIAVDKLLVVLEKDGCDVNLDWCAGYAYKSTAPGGSWREYVEKPKAQGGCEKTKPPGAGDINLHGHHIVMKKKFETWTGPSRQILCKYGINPYTGCENLTVTRNRCHSQRYAEKVLKALKEADENEGTRDAIMGALNKMAVWHSNCGDSGAADKNTDE